MDTNNPAVAQLTNIPPKLLEEVADNPAKFEPVARVMAAVHLDDLYRRMQLPDTPLPVRLEFQKMVNKMGRMEAKDDGAALGGGFVFNINFRNSETVRIEAAPVERETNVIESTAETLPCE